jgi:hypothetical protein
MKTLTPSNFLPILFLLLLSALHGQDKKVEIQVYTAPLTFIEAEFGSDGPLEYDGPSFEYYIKENTSIGLSASINSARNDELSQLFSDPDTENSFIHDYSIRNKNRLLTFYYRKYLEGMSGTKTFVGGYLRYWFHSDERLDTDQYSQEYRESLTRNKVPISLVDHKISIGFLTGVKIELSEIVCLNFTGGLGGSLPFMYFRNEKHFNEEDNRVITLKKANGIFSSEQHVSLIGHVSLGFRF